MALKATSCACLESYSHLLQDIQSTIPLHTVDTKAKKSITELNPTELIQAVSGKLVPLSAYIVRCQEECCHWCTYRILFQLKPIQFGSCKLCSWQLICCRGLTTCTTNRALTCMHMNPLIIIHNYRGSRTAHLWAACEVFDLTLEDMYDGHHTYAIMTGWTAYTTKGMSPLE